MNSHIQEYLNYYVSLDTSPYFSVLISGRWGSGKTWFIKNFANDKATKRVRYLYVSLYGLSKLTDIEEIFFQQLHPTLSSKPFTIGTKIAKGFLKGALKIDLNSDGTDDRTINYQIPDIDIPKYLNNTERHILVFDDLERSNIKMEDLLGHINYFVEHQGQKVIILADEDKIKSEYKEIYLQRKEKLIGRTFLYIPEVENAFDSFVENISDGEVLEFINSNKNIFINIFTEDENTNLRAMRKSILEFERFYGMLPKNAKMHKEFMTSCLESFLAISIYIDSGLFRAKDISNLSSNVYKEIATRREKQNDKAEEGALEKFFSKYFRGSIENIIPGEDVLEEFFVRGTVVKEKMNTAVKLTKFFNFNNLPDWCKLWYFEDLSAIEFKEMFSLVKRNMFGRKIVKEGEFRHVAGLFLMYAKNGIIEESHPKMFSSLKELALKMTENCEIEYLNLESRDRSGRYDDGYDGKAFFERETGEFKEISKILKEGFENRRQMFLISEADHLLNFLEKSPRKFYDAITSGGGQARSFAYTPILIFIDEKKFIENFLKATTESRDISYALAVRYKHRPKELLTEVAWLYRLQKEIVRQKGTQKDSFLSYKLSRLGSQIDFAISAMAEIEDH